MGRALRRARSGRGLTLRDVGMRSAGKFTPTAVAGYERGERKISLQRFCELAPPHPAPRPLLLLALPPHPHGFGVVLPSPFEAPTRTTTGPERPR